MADLQLGELGESEIGTWFRYQMLLGDEQISFKPAIEHLYRGLVDSDDAHGDANTRKLRCRALDYLGAVVQTGVTGWVEVTDVSATSAAGGYKGFTMAQDGSDGTVINDTFASQGRLLVKTRTAGEYEFDGKITAPSGAQVANAGVQTRFRLLRGVPMLDSMGTEEHDDFS